MSKKSKSNPIIVTSSQLCGLVDVSPTMFTRWKKLGLDAQVGHGKWDLKSFLFWWLENVYFPKDNASIADSRARWESARAEKVEIEVSRMKGSLLPRDEAMTALKEIVMQAKKSFMILPKSAPSVLYGQDEVEMLETLEGMVHTILRGMAKMAEPDEIVAQIDALSK